MMPSRCDFIKCHYRYVFQSLLRCVNLYITTFFKTTLHRSQKINVLVHLYVIHDQG